MTPAELTITRPHEGEWHALDGDLDVGVAYAMHRPDQRWFITLDSWRDDAYQTLLTAVTCDIQQDLYITVNDSDYEQLDLVPDARFHGQPPRGRVPRAHRPSHHRPRGG